MLQPKSRLQFSFSDCNVKKKLHNARKKQLIPNYELHHKKCYRKDFEKRSLRHKLKLPNKIIYKTNGVRMTQQTKEEIYKNYLKNYHELHHKKCYRRDFVKRSLRHKLMLFKYINELKRLVFQFINLSLINNVNTFFTFFIKYNEVLKLLFKTLDCLVPLVI